MLILTYGAEIQTRTKTDIGGLTAPEMRFLRNTGGRIKTE
jgi:hypothetical protein